MSDSQPPAPDPTLLSDNDSGYDRNVDPNHSTSSSLEPPPFNDIGGLLNPTMSIESVSETVSNLSNNEKYNFLDRHIEPPRVLPITLVCVTKCKFNTSWIKKYPWLLYSPKLDGVFCGPCSLLFLCSKRRDKGLLVNRPYSNWAKISNDLCAHCSLAYNRDCLQKADILKSTI